MTWRARLIRKKFAVFAIRLPSHHSHMWTIIPRILNLDHTSATALFLLSTLASVHLVGSLTESDFVFMMAWNAWTVFTLVAIGIEIGFRMAERDLFRDGPEPDAAVGGVQP